MIEGFATFFTSFKKVAPVPLLAISIATGIILFTPPGFSRTLGIDEFRETYRGWIGSAFILSLSYLAAHLAWWLRSIIMARRKRKQAEKTRNQHLHDLTAEEKGYLAPFVFDGVNTQNFDIDDGIAGGLTPKGIIYRASIIFDVVHGSPYNIQPWARAYLRSNPQLLEGARLRGQAHDPHAW